MNLIMTRLLNTNFQIVFHIYFWNYFQFEGYGESLFKNDPYDKDDEDADKIYDMIDNRQDEKRRDYRFDISLSFLKPKSQF